MIYVIIEHDGRRSGVLYAPAVTEHGHNQDQDQDQDQLSSAPVVTEQDNNRTELHYIYICQALSYNITLA